MFQELFPILTTGDLPRTLGIGADQAAAGNGPAPDRTRFTLWVYADDCDAAVEHLRGHGVPVLAEPADQPWGSGWPRSPTRTATG